MTDQNEVAQAVDFVYKLAMTVMGQQQACEHLLNAVITVVVENDPSLLAPIKEQFNDVADLHRRMIESEILLGSYNEHVDKLTKHFTLMKGGGFFKDE